MIESMTVDAAVQLHYDDGTNTQVPVSIGAVDIWQHMNITGSLDPDKNLAGISFFWYQVQRTRRDYTIHG
jgi:hypothetical protein